MKTKTHLIALMILSIGLLTACSVEKNKYQLTQNYTPDDGTLYKTIVALDSAFFQTYLTVSSPAVFS